MGALYFSELFPAAELRPAVFVKDFFVAAEARRRGVARAMLARLRESARGRDADRIELLVVAQNHGARAFYEAEGLSVRDSQLIMRAEP